MSPTAVFDGVSSAEVGGADVVEVICHHEHQARGGEELEQVAVVRLADGRWAVLSFYMFSRTRPFTLAVTVGASFDRVWWFGVEDDDRDRLAPQVEALLSPHEPTLAFDADEARFVDALRARPDDAATREVYADFLEQRGAEARAQVARIGDAPAHRHYSAAELASAWPPIAIAMPREEAAWRAVVVDAPIVRCGMTEQRNRPVGLHVKPLVGNHCDRTWRTAGPTGHDLVRRCPARGVTPLGELRGCDGLVRYCTSLQACADAGTARESIVLDPALDQDAALRAYDREAWRFEPRPVPLPAEPPEAPARPGLWARVRRWFE